MSNPQPLNSAKSNHFVRKATTKELRFNISKMNKELKASPHYRLPFIPDND